MTYIVTAAKRINSHVTEHTMFRVEAKNAEEAEEKAKKWLLDHGLSFASHITNVNLLVNMTVIE